MYLKYKIGIYLSDTLNMRMGSNYILYVYVIKIKYRKKKSFIFVVCYYR